MCRERALRQKTVVRSGMGLPRTQNQSTSAPTVKVTF